VRIGADLVVVAPKWRYRRGMPSVQIKNVPEDVHRILRSRAAAAGQSLQEYLLALLVDEARMLPPDVFFDRISGRTGGSLSVEDAVKWIREDRDSR
jgi:antitoxin FitA